MRIKVRTRCAWTAGKPRSREATTGWLRASTKEEIGDDENDRRDAKNPAQEVLAHDDLRCASKRGTTLYGPPLRLSRTAPPTLVGVAPISHGPLVTTPSVTLPMRTQVSETRRVACLGKRGKRRLGPCAAGTSTRREMSARGADFVVRGWRHRTGHRPRAKRIGLPSRLALGRRGCLSAPVRSPAAPLARTAWPWVPARRESGSGAVAAVAPRRQAIASHRSIAGRIDRCEATCQVRASQLIAATAKRVTPAPRRCTLGSSPRRRRSASAMLGAASCRCRTT